MGRTRLLTSAERFAIQLELTALREHLRVKYEGDRTQWSDRALGEYLGGLSQQVIHKAMLGNMGPVVARDICRALDTTPAVLIKKHGVYTTTDNRVLARIMAPSVVPQQPKEVSTRYMARVRAEHAHLLLGADREQLYKAAEAVVSSVGRNRQLTEREWFNLIDEKLSSS